MVTFKTKTYECVLPNPQVGNSDDVLRGVKVNVARSGRLRTVLTTNSNNSANYIISNLAFTVDRKKLEEFKGLLNCVGEPLTYTDKDGVEWQAVLDLETFDYVSSRRFKFAEDPERPETYHDELGYDFQIVIRKWK